MNLKDYLFPIICYSFLNESKDPNVITISVNIDGNRKGILKVWLDSSKTNLMFSIVDGKDLVKHKKDVSNLMSTLISGKFFRDSFLKKYLEANGVKIIRIENLSKGGADIYGLQFSYFRIKLENSQDLDKQFLISMLLEFKRWWNSTGASMKILDIN